MDELAWTRYKHAQHKRKCRDHVLQVTHVKAQNVIGQGTLGIYYKTVIICCCFFHNPLVEHLIDAQDGPTF